MPKNIKILQNDLRREKKCCNFASAIGKQRGTAMKARRSEDGCAKIENNDMMPQDKQRQSSDWAQQRQGNTRLILGVHVNEIPSYK